MAARVGKALRAVRAALLVIGVVGVVFVLAASVVPGFLGYGAAIVTSGSMGDALPVGSVAFTRTVDVAEIAVGDVITFRHASSEPTTTHRVVATALEDGSRVFTTKGDANAAGDARPVVASSGRLPLVIASFPFAGYALDFARGPVGLFLFVILPVAGLLFDRQRPGRGGRKGGPEADTAAEAEEDLRFALAGVDPVVVDPPGAPPLLVEPVALEPETTDAGAFAGPSAAHSSGAAAPAPALHGEQAAPATAPAPTVPVAAAPEPPPAVAAPAPAPIPLEAPQEAAPVGFLLLPAPAGPLPSAPVPLDVPVEAVAPAGRPQPAAPSVPPVISLPPTRFSAPLAGPAPMPPAAAPVVQMPPVPMPSAAVPVVQMPPVPVPSAPVPAAQAPHPPAPPVVPAPVAHAAPGLPPIPPLRAPAPVPQSWPTVPLAASQAEASPVPPQGEPWVRSLEPAAFASSAPQPAPPAAPAAPVAPAAPEPPAAADPVPSTTEVVAPDEPVPVMAPSVSGAYRDPKRPADWSWEFVPESGRRRGWRR